MKQVLYTILFASLYLISPGQEKLKVLEPEIGPYRPLSQTEFVKLSKEIKKVFDFVSKMGDNYDDVKKNLTARQRYLYENYANDPYMMLVDEEYEINYTNTAEMGCSWYCGGGFDSIYATSTLAPNGNITYKANNAHDFSLATAWVEGAPGYGIGESITFQLINGSSLSVTHAYIYNGYMKSEKAYRENSRVKKLKLYANGKPYAILNLADTIAVQAFDIGEHKAISDTKPLLLKFEIMEVYQGSKYDDVAISETNFSGGGVHCFAGSTQVTMADGSTKSIENLSTGDEILTLNEQTGQVEPATIQTTATAIHHNLYELDFDGTKIITTADHPFYSEQGFFSVIANSLYGVNTNTFTEGNNVLFQEGGRTISKKLTSITPLSLCIPTYTITGLSKNRIFFANGLSVGIE